ncbi:hypothetical protein F0562_015291 [Nyssa sinensis]|uniref:Uncharacterized protein n=1 Tax=Nyssa sinensis TaxID=561372 RepID=A0A5J4ZKJ9_9ASTE|nr:hypothetical protein F0562_015291 [Nyssa sinensis]
MQRWTTTTTVVSNGGKRRLGRLASQFLCVYDLSIDSISEFLLRINCGGHASDYCSFLSLLSLSLCETAGRGREVCVVV